MATNMRNNVMHIELVYIKSADEQCLMQLIFPEKTCIRQIIQDSGLLEKYPEININKNKFGVFSKICSLDDCPVSGDRIEIYRPLLLDPKKKRLAKLNDQKNYIK